ncbi:MAG: CotH kinase family protein, partial [Planctomycetota bacterium]|nr:CotH kinase family protein [Planctomycetota bacterium]
MNREELARTLPSAVLVAAVLSAVAPPGEAGGSPPEDARLTVPFLLDCGPSGRERDDEDEWRERRRRTAGIRTLRDRRYSRRSGYGHEGGEGFRQWFAGVSGIWGRVEPDLYASGRHAPESYLFDLPAGDYVVALGFCELEEHRAGRRVFDIVLQGDEVARGFDIFAAGGYSQAIHRVFPARVRQGERLTVVLRRAPESARAPQLNTIRVHPLRETGEPPPPPEDLRGVGSYSMNVLFWSHPEDERVAGYVVERRAPGEEEFSRATREPVPGARWMDDRLSPGKAYRYRVASVDFRGRRSAFSREVELRPRDPGDSPLPVYSLRVAEDDLNAVLEDVREDRVVAAKLEVEGKKHTVLFRVRGASTRNAAKLSYRLEFIGRRPPPGRRVIYLKGEPSDHTLQQEKLTCDLFTALGLPVSSARYVNLFLNGRYRGLYLDIDRIDTGFVR